MDWYNVQNHSFFSSSIASQMTSLFIAIYSLEHPLQCLINHDKLYYFKEPLHDFLALLLSQNTNIRLQDIENEIDYVFYFLHLWLKVDRTITPGRIANNWSHKAVHIFEDLHEKKIGYNHGYCFLSVDEN